MKRFLIIGNMNAVTTKDIFPLFKENKIWYGITVHSGNRAFNVPDDYPLEAMNCGIDKDGKRFIKVKGVRWFTNLPHNSKRILELTQRYDPDKYPKYDNYDAIEVSRIKDIPYDYDGVMGVPISFLDKWCPEQFKIVDARDYDLNNKCDEQSARPFIEGNEIYRRVLNQHNIPQSPNETFTYVNGEKKYARVFIKHSHPNPLAGGGAN